MSPVFSRRLRRSGLVLVLALTGLGLAACSKPPASTGAAAPTADAIADRAPPALAEVNAGELRSRAQAALREQRIFAPAGDNAIEFYLALRDRDAKADVAVQGALMELEPYAVIGAEQALARGEFDEAERVRGMVGRIDPQAPSLARLSDAIATAKQAHAENELKMAAEAAARAAAEALPAGAAEPPPAAGAPVASAPVTPPAASAVATAAHGFIPSVPAPATGTPTATSSAPPVAKPVVAAAEPRRSVPLVPVRNPQPEYPDEKRGSGAVGEVVASFTVSRDGSVTDVDTQSIGARQLAFERSVVAALRRWKFQPIDEPKQVKLSFAFAP